MSPKPPHAGPKPKPEPKPKQPNKQARTEMLMAAVIYANQQPEHSSFVDAVSDATDLRKEWLKQNETPEVDDDATAPDLPSHG